MERLSYVYVTYIATSPDKLWQALVDPKTTARYWQHANVSDWRPGSRWEHRSADGENALHMLGKVIESTPPRRLVITWAFPEDEQEEERHTRVTFDLEPTRDVMRLTVTHAGLEAGSEMLEGITDGWPKVLSSLKSMLEVGRPLPQLW